MITLSGKEAFITDPESEEGRVQNILLNMMGGLEFHDLTFDEKVLLIKHGYEPNEV